MGGSFLREGTSGHRFIGGRGQGRHLRERPEKRQGAVLQGAGRGRAGAEV